MRGSDSGLGRAGPWRALLSTLGIVTVTVAGVAVLTPCRRLPHVEGHALDALFALRRPRPPDPRLIIVDAALDTATEQRFRRPEDSPASLTPIPRRAYAEAIRRLSRWGTKAVLMDLWFRAACPPASSEDRELATALRRAGNVVVAAVATTTPEGAALSCPVPLLTQAAWAVGSPVVHHPYGTIRSASARLHDRDTGRAFWALGLLAWERALGPGPAHPKLRDGRWVEAGGRRVPLRPNERPCLWPRGSSADPLSDGSPPVRLAEGPAMQIVPRGAAWNLMLINWCGPPGTIPATGLSDVLAMDEATGRRRFAGKVAILGLMTGDRHHTSVGPMSGPEIQANILDTLLSERPLRALDPWAFLGLLAVFAALGDATARRLRGLPSLAAAAVIVAGAVLLAMALLTRGLWLYWSLCLAAAFTSWALASLLESGALTALVARFVPAFLKSRQARAGGQVRTIEATVLFSDIRGFTATAERLPPEQVLRLLRAYQSAVEDIITRHGGTVVKTPGDAILALFWKTRAGRTPAACALQAGRELLDDLPRWAGEWESRGDRLAIGIGLSAGPVAIGFVGKHHLEPTVIGDPVNVAQRLEELTKTTPCSLVFSEAVRDRLGEVVEAEPLQEVMVEGRQEPVRAYGLLGP